MVTLNKTQEESVMGLVLALIIQQGGSVIVSQGDTDRASKEYEIQGEHKDYGVVLRAVKKGS